MHEVGKLIKVLHALVDRGASVVVIEHNTDMGSDHRSWQPHCGDKARKKRPP